MAKRGPKPRYTCPADLQAAVDAYFEEMEEKGEFPDLAGMRIYLRMSASTIAAYQDEEHDNYKEYRRIFEDARDRRESFLVRKMTREPKMAQGCLNALKQASNGGYIDRPADSGGKIVLEINTNGLKGGMDSFK